MSYHRPRKALGQFQPGVYGLRPGADMAVGVPGPMSPMGMSMPASLFPTNVKWGDVVTVQVPPDPMGLHQGSILVRFQGVPAIAPDMMSNYGGSVVVPVGAETGACTIEVDGRTVFGTNCVVSKGLSGGGLPAQAPEHAAVAAWKTYTLGPGSPLHGGPMNPYFADRYQGVGAIAAHDPAPRSAPAPTLGKLVAAKRRLAVAIPSSPTLTTSRGVPIRPTVDPPRVVYPGVTVTPVGPSRPPIITGVFKTSPSSGPVLQPLAPTLPPRRPTPGIVFAPIDPKRRTPTPLPSPPSVSIGTGIGTQTMTPSTSYSGGGGGGSTYDESFDADSLRPEFDEAPLEVTALPPKRMGTGLKVALAAGALAAVYWWVTK